MASLLGTGLAADAFFLAWTIPNLGRRLFGEGAFAAALIPVFVDAREKGDLKGARHLVNAATTRLLLLLLALIFLGEGLLWLLRGSSGEVIASSLGLDPQLFVRSDLVLVLTQSLLPYLGFICLAGVLGGVLNALNRFSVPAAAPVVLNLTWIAALLLGGYLVVDPLGRVCWLTLALVGAGVLQLLLHTEALHRVGLPVKPRLSADPELLRRVRTLFLSLAVGLGVFQLNVLLDSLIAYGFVSEGGVSSLYFANRLVQLPIGVLGVALSTAVFPELARRAKRNDLQGLGAIMDRGLAVGAFVSLPAAAGLMILSDPLVTTLFERGAFDAESAARTGRVLLFLSPAVITACVTPVITRGFYAEEEVKLPVRISLVCVVLNLILNLALVGHMQEAGLALATAISQGLNLVLQAWFYRRRRVARDNRPATGETLRSVGRTLLLSFLMAGGALAAFTFLPGPESMRLGVAVAAGVLIYGGLAYALHVPELSLLLARQRPKT